MLGPRLLSYHNLALLLQLVREAQTAIVLGTWSEFRDDTLAALEPSEVAIRHDR